MDPLLHPEDFELEAQLRRAGRDVGLSPAAQARLLTALGVSAGVTAASEAAASAGFVGKLLASKGMLAAASVVSIGAIGAGVYFTQRTPTSESVGDRAPETRSAEVAHAVTSPRDAGAAEREAADGAVLAPEQAPVSVDKPATQPRTSARKPAADAPAGLRDELALVEAVSRATKAGNGALALSQSLEYKRRFPRGKLALEAQVLHIEALALAGNRTEASRLAQSFLKRYPDSPVAARIRRYAH
jgi:hypothetical protein